MDALQEAHQSLETYEVRVNKDRRTPELEEASYRLTMMLAAIAQAEQLKRIADALEVIAHPNRILAPDPQDYFSEDEYNAAAERYDYHKHSEPGESMAEYKARRNARFASHEVGR